MDRYEKTLTLILRIVAVVSMTAVFAVVMPAEWMSAIHRRLGMGELPQGPIMGYLTRSLSALYAAHGAMLFFVSLDVRRYLPLVRCLAVIGVLFGAAVLALDVAVGLPMLWIVCEGPFIIGLGCVLWWLTGRLPPDCNLANPADPLD